MTRRGTLLQAGPLLYGSAWKTDLCKALGERHPDGPRKQIDDRLMRRWATGQRPIPNWVLPAVCDLILLRCEALKKMLPELAKLIEENS